MTRLLANPLPYSKHNEKSLIFILFTLLFLTQIVSCLMIPLWITFDKKLFPTLNMDFYLEPAYHLYLPHTTGLIFQFPLLPILVLALDSFRTILSRARWSALLCGCVRQR